MVLKRNAPHSHRLPQDLPLPSATVTSPSIPGKLVFMHLYRPNVALQREGQQG